MDAYRRRVSGNSRRNHWFIMMTPPQRSATKYAEKCSTQLGSNPGNILQMPKASTLHPPRPLEEKWWPCFIKISLNCQLSEKNKNADPEDLMYTAIDMLPSQRTSCIQQRTILPMRTLQGKGVILGGEGGNPGPLCALISELHPGLDFFIVTFIFYFIEIFCLHQIV